MNETTEKIRQLAESNITHCPFCNTHSKKFIATCKRYEHKRRIHAFSSSPAFFEAGQWYHLKLNSPEAKSRGGYVWAKCEADEHHEYLALIDGEKYTLDEAIQFAAEYMATIGEPV